MAVWIEDRRVKIRRATRHDVGAIGARLGVSIGVRFGRRAVADRRDDVYVADEIGGGLVGVVGLAYRRSLSAGGVVVDVDPLEAARESVRTGLLDFAVARARRRGAIRVVVVDDGRRAVSGAGPETAWASGRIRLLPLGGPG